MTLVDFQTYVNTNLTVVRIQVGGRTDSFSFWRRSDNLDNVLGVPNSEIDGHIAAWLAEVGTDFIQIDHDLYMKTQNI